MNRFKNYSPIFHVDSLEEEITVWSEALFEEEEIFNSYMKQFKEGMKENESKS